MKCKIFLLLLFISLTPFAFSYYVDGGGSDIGYMKSELVLSLWDVTLLDPELDGYLLGTGVTNTFGNEYLFLGTNFMLFHHIKESSNNVMTGFNFGLEVGTLIHINERDSILAALGYNYLLVSLDDTKHSAYIPSIRIGYKRGMLITSIGYNLDFNVFTTIGFEQSF